MVAEVPLTGLSFVGSDLVASFSGSIDTTGLARVSGESVGSQSIAAADPSSSIISFGFTAANGDAFADEYQISAAQFPPFAQLKTISTNIASTGDYFSAGAFPGLSDTLVVPLNYSSGNPLSGTITFAGESIASVFGTNLSTTPTVMFTLGNNDVSYALVPEPGSLAVLGLAGLGVGLAAWRRRKKGKSPEAGIRC